MLDPRPLQARIQAQLRQALHSRAVERGLLSITVATPELSLSGLPPLAAPYFYWARPDADQQIFGLGEAVHMAARGRRRFRELAAAYRRWRSAWAWMDPDDTGMEPVVFTGFAFDGGDLMDGPWRGFPNAGLMLSALQLHRCGNHSALTFSCVPERSGDRGVLLERWSALTERLLTSLNVAPEPSGRRTPLTRLPGAREADWLAMVREAVTDIRRGAMTKVVPSRRIRVRGARPLGISRLVASLAYMYPSCTLIAADLGGRALASATPERLLALDGGELLSDAVGGTIRRAAAETEDERLGEMLRTDPKARHEHAVVVEHIGETLGRLCDTVSAPEGPTLLKLRNLQHLRTRLRGLPHQGVSLLDAAEHMHPTPAVGGLPVDTASRWLRRHDALGRGWYTGAAGWIGRSGDGELSVLLRCALLEGRYADLFAGAGVVGDSQPEAELEETELKFDAVLEALANA